ncbi:hypothetical protein COCVIDRAFT_41985 [Bipolaris victoriae FI3]|uniref:Heterokaryon incompatibility domain-containing protein n=1 Tax=Bipolaris victoriae (strain FI3) TaxID=930091 RepID=W7E4W9_BIPV3|nr:hypothetical protein COCVIDRAFT_41985 [Bipolaris victoriae FI3]
MSKSLALPRVIPTQDSAWSSFRLFSKNLHEDLLSEYHSLDEFFDGSLKSVTFWFFQKRGVFMSQSRSRKWSREVLNDYVLLPAALDYTLRFHQAQLETQTWSYIWVDWTCLPQHPQSPPEKTYFHYGLRTMLYIIRNTGFAYFYPPFEPRL